MGGPVEDDLGDLIDWDADTRHLGCNLCGWYHDVPTPGRIEMAAVVHLEMEISIPEDWVLRQATALGVMHVLVRHPREYTIRIGRSAEEAAYDYSDLIRGMMAANVI